MNHIGIKPLYHKIHLNHLFLTGLLHNQATLHSPSLFANQSIGCMSHDIMAEEIELGLNLAFNHLANFYFYDNIALFVNIEMIEDLESLFGNRSQGLFEIASQVFYFVYRITLLFMESLIDINYS